MPLYEHISGERVRTVAGGPEDQRLAASPSWSLVDETGEEPVVVKSARRKRPPMPKNPPASAADVDDAPREATGRGTAVVNLGGDA